jgi:hypothetical protein
MKTPTEWKAFLRRRQGYEDNSTWVAVWVEDIQEIWNEGFEAGKQAVKQNEDTKDQDHSV